MLIPKKIYNFKTISNPVRLNPEGIKNLQKEIDRLISYCNPYFNEHIKELCIYKRLNEQLSSQQGEKR